MPRCAATMRICLAMPMTCSGAPCHRFMSLAMRARWKLMLGRWPFLAAAAARAALEQSAKAAYCAAHCPGLSSKFSRCKHISSWTTSCVQLVSPCCRAANFLALTRRLGPDLLVRPMSQPSYRGPIGQSSASGRLKLAPSAPLASFGYPWAPSWKGHGQQSHWYDTRVQHERD
jgi:hypothetical protein